jgi:hypothetical protein
MKRGPSEKIHLSGLNQSMPRQLQLRGESDDQWSRHTA